MSRSRILILSFSPLATDPRVGRQIELLAGEHEVVAAGFGTPRDSRAISIDLPSKRRAVLNRLGSALRLLARRHDAYYWRIDSVQAALDRLSGQRFDLIIANDSSSWPLACRLAAGTGARLLFDAHEYAPLEFEDVLWWRLLFKPHRTAICKRDLPRADGVLTVCEGIADEYARVFGIPRPIVVSNTPPLQPLSASPVEPGRVRMVHHGGATRSRRIENMIRMFDHLDSRFTLDLILVPSEPACLADLRRLASGEPRIRFLEPVPMPRIPASLNAYDLGLYLLEPNSFNNRHALPNKFFEFVQARLGVAIGPSPEMAHLVRRHGLGLVADDFSPRSLAASLNALTPERLAEFKAAAHRAAPVLSWDQESRKLRSEVDRLLALGPCAA